VVAMHAATHGCLLPAAHTVLASCHMFVASCHIHIHMEPGSWHSPGAPPPRTLIPAPRSSLHSQHHQSTRFRKPALFHLSFLAASKRTSEQEPSLGVQHMLAGSSRGRRQGPSKVQAKGPQRTHLAMPAEEPEVVDDGSGVWFDFQELEQPAQWSTAVHRRQTRERRISFSREQTREERHWMAGVEISYGLQV